MFDGYCNENHFKQGAEVEYLMTILAKHKHLSTIRDARKFVAEEAEKKPVGGS
jgi:hypothetical protein